MRTCGVILSGGKSSRMGTNKALLKLGNKKVIEHIADELQSLTDEVIIVTNEPSLYTFLDLQLICDRHQDKGPLAGLESAFHHINADTFVVAACDMPFVKQSVYAHLLQQTENYDAAVPIYNRQIHPLSAVYKRSVLPLMQQRLENNELQVKGFYDQIHVNYINEYGDLADEVVRKHFFNMNNPEEYEQAKLL
ncbi:molybdenum cofactor guanylyltransferase [Virgibacillus sp. C22-A2]|uniref:Probable molybdenum cofactor guanylyltransferase n=1 Tax=Virgibacillus tibetensis TaxID=3042313 RepID=A0ABU6KC72_9BACI|nr:molybdenum cofactor guanylyltransferase [Virgibacillus sp. C22-A2]